MKTIMVPDHVHQALKELADREIRTIAGELEYILNDYKQAVEEE